MEIPEWAKKPVINKESADWSDTIARLQIKGVPLESIQGMTLMQLHHAVKAVSEDLKERYRIGGFEVKDEEDTHVINAGNAEMLKNMINTAIRGH
jgi:hypothetical protein